MIVIALLSRIPLAFIPKDLTWDGAVYLMNAKWFAGQKIFFEALRPPFLSSFFSIFISLGITSELFFRIMISLFSAMSIFLTYYVAKKFFGEKAGFLSAAVLIFLPIHVLWTPRILTGIPSSVFVLLFILTLYKGLKDEKYLYISSFFAALAFLTRYPLGILILAMYVFLLFKKTNIKNIIISFAIYIATVAPWLIYNFLRFGDFLYSFKEGIKYSGVSTQPIYFYLVTLPKSFSFLILVILFGLLFSIKYIKKDEKLQLLAITILIFGIAMCLFKHKEERYLLPIIPLLIIFSSYFAEKINWKKWVPFVVVLTIASIPFAIPHYSNCYGIKEISQNLNGVVASEYWPLTAYYGNVKVAVLPPKEEYFESFLRAKNISYIIAASNGWWPPYASNFSFYDSKAYLEFVKETNDSCHTYRLYRVKL